MTAAFLFILLFALMIIGVPIAISLGLSAMVTILLFGQDSLASLTIKFFQAMQEGYTLLAIPFFVLAGNFMTTGGVARRMIDFAIAAVGHLPGGLAIASVFACMLFAAVSGSSPATVVAVGSVVIAGMVRTGYTLNFASGIICNAGTLGILIPPSIVMVVYAATTETSVGRLFIAGVIPGILLGLMLMVAILVVAIRKKLPREPWPGFWPATQRVLKAGGIAAPGLLLILIVLGGIYGGAFTPTEAAAVSAVYAAIVALLIYRDLKISDVPHVLVESGRVTVMLMFIIANAFLFSHVLTTEQIPQNIARAITEAGLSQWQFLVVVNIILLIAGNFMEPSSIILILAPILFPIATQLGVDPVHLGIIMTVNMEIGMVTPPVGLNLFVTSGVTGQSVTQVVRAAMPWLSVLFVFLIIVTYVPSLSLFLPNLLFGRQ
jgi:C4-dicarboxylate transporter DctM subunit